MPWCTPKNCLYLQMDVKSALPKDNLMGTITNHNNPPRTTIRLALPSKGRMEEETLELLRDCGLTVQKVNPRQYIASIAQLPNLEVWFQRSADVVRKVRDGDADLGIVGFDMIAEYQGTDA